MTLADPMDCPLYLISRSSLVVAWGLRRTLASSGMEQVRPAYLGVLLILWTGDGMRSVDLARRVGLEPSSMTGLLDRMERDGLLKRRADPDDRRAQRIYLTEVGREAEGPVNGVVDQAVREVLGDIPAEDVEHLSATLRQILDNADRMGK